MLKPKIVKKISIDSELDIKDISPDHKQKIVEAVCQFDSRVLYRDIKRRNGRIELFKTVEDSTAVAKITWGPYKLETRKEILKGLLEKQKEIQELAQNHSSQTPEEINLISQEELHQIRKIWRFEEGDWQDSLPAIYQEIFAEKFEGLIDDTSGLGGAEQKILSEICKDFDIPERMLMELFEVERRHQGMGRRAGVYNKLSSVLKKDWHAVESSLKSIAEEPADADQ